MKAARRNPKRNAAKPSKRREARSGKHRNRFITKAAARRRAARHFFNRMFKRATVLDGAAARWPVFGVASKYARREVWLVYKNSENPMELKSAEIIAVCKRTGRVLYEGSAGDEG